MFLIIQASSGFMTDVLPLIDVIAGGFQLEKGQIIFFSADFWEGDATKHFSVKKGVFSEKGGDNSVNEGFGKDFYKNGNSVKRFGQFTEPPDSEN